MHRRAFVSSGLVSVGSLLSARVQAAAVPEPPGDPHRTWQFWDLWHVDRMSELSHRQGRAEWQREATFAEPHIGNLSGWPTVFRNGRGWRMLYSAAWKPYSLMVADSDDGLTWQPAPQPDIRPAGGKRAPHHIFTLPSGSGGAVYQDPVAKDGFPFKVFVHQQGEPVAERAKQDPAHHWHTIASREGSKRYINEEFVLVSQDGLHWQERRDLNWSLPHWHPEPPIFGFYDRAKGRHGMTVRPGWGDRRQCLQFTSDFHDWSGPQLTLQPDALDEELIELYGMPVFPVGNEYVGLLWIFHCESDEPTRSFNRFVGPLDCQLAYSYDGTNFTRGKREPVIATNAPGEHGGGAIQPSSLVETDAELRIYSAASKVFHGRGRAAAAEGLDDVSSILLHTLRKDGFTYLEGRGNWGHLASKPLTLSEPGLTMNAIAPFGEVRYQLSDLESHPIEGFTFDDCLPLRSAESLDAPLRWRNQDTSQVVNKIFRLEFKLRHAQLFAVRGATHFLDAQDRWMLGDGKPIDTRFSL